MARNFNGTSDVIDIGTPAPLNISANSQIAVSVWMNPTAQPSSGSDADISGKGFDGTTTSYEMKISGSGAGNLIFFGSFSGGGHGAGSGGLATTNGVWTHLYGDYDGATWHLYVNGILQGSSTDAIGPQNNTMRSSIGALWLNGSFGNWFNGRVAHRCEWNQALTAPEVKQLALGRSPLTIRPGRILGYWPLSMGYGQPAIDRGPFNLGSGTITGTKLAPDPPLTTISQINLLDLEAPFPFVMVAPPALLMAQIVL